MPNLGDYIGQLVSEMTMARMQADLEAVRVAELYASHPLLKNLPVPHFRLPEVELDLPVVVNQAPDPPPGLSPRGGVGLDEMRRVLPTVLDGVLRDEHITLPDAARASLLREIDRSLVAVAGPTEVGVDVRRYADAFATTAMLTLGEHIRRQPSAPSTETGSMRTPEALKERLLTAGVAELLGVRRPPTRLGVLVHTSHVREAGGPEHVTRMKLKLTESGFEWIESEREGTVERRLIEE